MIIVEEKEVIGVAMVSRVFLLGLRDNDNGQNSQ